MMAEGRELPLYPPPWDPHKDRAQLHWWIWQWRTTLRGWEELQTYHGGLYRQEARRTLDLYERTLISIARYLTHTGHRILLHHAAYAAAVQEELFQAWADDHAL